ncbi:MAG TPA: RNase adapter RapZ [Candidatus Limnocylindria bacterium]|nr:RNase adapter RapZ [Candidatus Limnocylindria bacterium]
MKEGSVARSAAAEPTTTPAATTGSASTRPTEVPPSHLLVISGLSGAGKSQASKLFEDLGYSVVDNLPPALLDDFLALRRAEPERYRRSALVLDIRSGDPAPAIQRAASALEVEGGELELIFLEASDASLVSRFSETRHRHPLEATRSGIQASIDEERRRLAPTRELANHVIDTSGLSIGQLKDRLFAIVPQETRTDDLRIDIVTFGFKYGIPLEADLVFDVRFLTNPYWEPELKPLSGLEPAVRQFVLDQPAANRFLELVTELLELTAPAYRAEGKGQLRVALGCTGGYHRSIALAQELAVRLGRLERVHVSVSHRELGR